MEAKNTGYVKIYRCIKHNWVWEDAEYLKAWITMLMECNHSDKSVLIDRVLYACKRGQSLKSVSQWVLAFGRGWTVSKARTFLKLLQTDGMVTTENLKKTTRLTICNYGSYQDSQQADNKEIADGQQGDSKVITSGQLSDNFQTTTNKNEEERKEGKEGKNEKNDSVVVTKIEEKPSPDSRLPFLEYFIRATSDIPKNILLKEIGKFLNKYPEVENPKKSIKLINAWCSRIEYTPPEKYSGMTDVKALVKKLYGDR